MSQTIENDAALKQVLVTLEVTRKKIAKKRKIDYIYLAVAFPALIIGYFSGFLIIGIAIFIPLIMIAIVRRNNRKDEIPEYQAQYKREVIAASLKYIDPSLSINPNTGIDVDEFNYCQLFDIRPQRFGTEDLVMGTAGKTTFYFSELIAEYQKEYQNKPAKKEGIWYEIFKGILFVADFNKNFNGVTVVRPKKDASAIDIWLSKHISFFANQNLVYLENPTFDKTFATYSSNQVEARYILTPAMMESILKLNYQSLNTIRLSFIESRMYIAFPLKRNYFEAPIYKSLLTSGTLYQDLSVIKFMYNIVKELGLNTRIWGKE